MLKVKQMSKWCIGLGPEKAEPSKKLRNSAVLRSANWYLCWLSSRCSSRAGVTTTVGSEMKGVQGLGSKDRSPLVLSKQILSYVISPLAWNEAAKCSIPPLSSWNSNLQSRHDNCAKEGRKIPILLVGLVLLFFLMLLIYYKGSGVQNHSFLISGEKSLEITVWMWASLEPDLKKLVLCNCKTFLHSVHRHLWETGVFIQVYTLLVCFWTWWSQEDFSYPECLGGKKQTRPDSDVNIKKKRNPKQWC